MLKRLGQDHLEGLRVIHFIHYHLFLKGIAELFPMSGQLTTTGGRMLPHLDPHLDSGSCHSFSYNIKTYSELFLALI